MSYSRIRKIIENSDSLYEDTLQQVLDDLHKPLATLDNIIEDEDLSYGAEDDVVERARLVKEHLLKAIEAGRVTLQEDGTVADLGTLPTLPLGMVDARGQSRKLSGSGKSKKMKLSKRKKQ